MRTLLIVGLLATAATACKKTGDNQYEVQKPVLGTVRETVTTPSVSISTETKKVEVPKVEMGKDTVTVKTPKIDIKKH